MNRVLLMLFLAAGMSHAYAQERVVTGRVTAASDGTSLPGVNVLLKGTTNGTTTDTEGNFTITVPQSGGVLSFSFIGLKGIERAITTESTVSIAMEDDATQLSEVVVTGLGWQQESKTLGYAVEKVDADFINQAKAMNVFTGLSGKVAGLQIRTTNNGLNPATRVTLRGNRSLTGNNQALVVLDGIIVPNNTLNSINNNDIENVTILKGASAAAIYGSDATNGVLLITLRKGNVRTPEINFSHTTQFEQLSFLPKFQNGWGPGTNAYSRGYISYENQSYGPAFDGSEVDLGKPREDGSMERATYSARPDAKKDVWDIGHLNQNFLSFAAGDDDTKFSMSLQDVRQTNIVPRDLYRRTGGRASAAQKVGRFQGSFNIIYNVVQQDQNNSPNTFYWDVLNHGANIDLPSYRNWRNYKNADGTLNFANPNNYANDYYENPYVGLDAYRFKTRTSELTGNAQIDYKPTSWLNLTYRAGITSNSLFSKGTAEKFDFTDYAASTRYLARADINGSVSDNASTFRRLQSDIIATFAKSFGPVDFQFITGAQATEVYNRLMSLSTTNLVVPGVYNISNRTGEVNGTEFYSNVRKVGAFGDMTLTYKDFITLHFAGRVDQTSLLARGNNTYFYPAVDMAFVPTDLFQMSDNSVLNFVKLTAGYAKVGQVNVGAYQLEPVFNVAGGFPFGSRPGFVVGNTLPDPGLQPEFLENLEFSSEFRMLRDRLDFSVTYYKQNADNQTVTISTSNSTGFSSALINAGEMENSGVELTLGGKIIDRPGQLEVGADLNYANRSTRVVSLYQGLDEVALGNNIFAIRGQQYPAAKVDRYKRDPQGRVVVDPETGYPLEDQAGLVYGGQTEPKHVFGITPYLKYKRFALSATAEYQAGHVIFHGSGETMTFTGVAAITATYGRERFIFPNSVIESTNTDGSVTYTPNTSVAVEDGGVGFWDNHYDAIGENYLTSAAFWKLREVQLSYKFPTALLGATKIIKKASIGLVGRNLLMLLPKSNLYTDPEFNVGTGNSVGFNNVGINPPTRFYGFNLDLTF